MLNIDEFAKFAAFFDFDGVNYTNAIYQSWSKRPLATYFMSIDNFEKNFMIIGNLVIMGIEDLSIYYYGKYQLNNFLCDLNYGIRILQNYGYQSLSIALP